MTDPAPHADHDQDDAAAEPLFDRAYWEDRYGAEGLAWSGRPNPVLVTEAEALTPGRALDIGSGEGGDAIWLAGLGWQVVGTDISSNALAKSARQAESVDAELAARIDWQQHDLVEWAPEARSFDLVTSQFMHLPDPVRTALFRSLAAAVAPGGTLLVVGHDLSDLDSGAHRMHHAELMFSVDDVLAAIDGEGLVVEVAESRPRLAPGADGGTVTVRDVVVRATRAS
nr:class I SAM-dependent methyltransferase [Frigoribacterium sp. PhB160]